MKRITIILLCAGLFACSKESLELLPNESFVKVFDDNDPSVNFTPLDIIQTQDQGYLTLSRLHNGQVYILKLSNRGDYIWSRTVNDSLVWPAPNLILSNDKYYFVATSRVDSSANLVEIDDLSQQVNRQTQNTLARYKHPLYFTRAEDGTAYMLSYNDSTGSVLSNLSITEGGFEPSWEQAAYDTARTGMLDNLAAYYAGQQEFPFFVGVFNSGNALYFNSIRPEGNTLTFTTELGVETGRLDGGQAGGVLAVSTNNDNSVALNYRFNGNSYLLNNGDLGLADSTSLEAIEGSTLPEQFDDTPARLALINLNGTEYLVSAINTIDRRIKLSFYQPLSGAFAATEYIGGSDAMEVVDIEATNDGGIILLTKIFVGGVEQRIAVWKIAQDELQALI